MKTGRALFAGLCLFILVAVRPTDATAQCSVCRAGAEANIKQGDNKRGRGLNNAILYLMSVPYVLGGIGGYVLWRNRKK